MSTVLNIANYIVEDDLAREISDFYRTWHMYRQNWLVDREEIQRYIFANDTTKTSNSALPWSNKTTIPKLCQIRDNLFANYMATLFPKKKAIIWEGMTEEDEAKADAITSYMSWAIDRPEFYHEVAKLVLDYIDYGNVFAMPEWVDKTSSRIEDGVKVGYVGPMLRRIAPSDIVFNPTAPSFSETPKIIRSVVSIGEVKEMIERENNPDRDYQEKLFKYMTELRGVVTGTSPVQAGVGNATQDSFIEDAIYQIAGFNNYRDYLASNSVEILTFYGDIYNEETGNFDRNQVIKIVDRHRILSKAQNPSFFGQAPIYHVGWRIRPDNLWAMGPLDNLVGMQYRIDHLENMKADIWDLTRYPVFAIAGYVEDFDWAPGEKIFMGDDGKVELLSPDVGALQANTEIALLEAKMEEMAGSPKEAMGFRTPGEKTKYEVQRLENAASRIFQNKTAQFEINFLERILNSMLELARRNMSDTTIRVLNDEFKIADFVSLSPTDITGQGRIKPMAARHFAEQAQLVQDLNSFFSSASGQDPNVLMHFSSQKIARMWERLLDIEDHKLVVPYVRISEAKEAQQLMRVAEEQSNMQTMTASGMGDDYDVEGTGDQAPGGMVPGAPGGPQGLPV